jgi:putative membrane protein
MATSTGKTIGLVLLIVLILVILFRVTPFFLMPLHMIPGFIRGFTGIGPIFPFEHMGSMEGLIISGGLLISVLILILWIAITIWVYRDAERRGMNGILWALLVFVGSIIGLLIYLIVRTDGIPRQVESPNTQPCPNCEKPVLPRYAFCPHCGTRLQAVCPKCNESVDSEWRVCPHCGYKLI